jgi:hypothetical protein
MGYPKKKKDLQLHINSQNGFSVILDSIQGIMKNGPAQHKLP